MERLQSLEHSLKHCWNLLFQAYVKRNHPMRTAYLATQSTDGPRVRTIVLRKSNAEERRLLFFCDVRSPKVQHLKKNSQAEVLFYDPKKKVQIRANGDIQIEQGSSLCKEYWTQLNRAGRSSYAAVPNPGAAMEEDQTGLPENWAESFPLSFTEYAFQNFCLLHLEVRELDLLHLHPEGHQRAGFNWNGQDWGKTWRIP